MASRVAEPLLIVGASARAAAESARRGGYHPLAIDLFADADLSEVAEVRLSKNYPYDIPSLARSMPAADWLYVGGLESYPDVIDELAAERRLLGCSGEVLRRVRSPKLLAEAMGRIGTPIPETIFDASDLRRLTEATTPTDEPAVATNSPATRATWLVKHRRSSGGLGVEPITDDELRAALDDHRHDPFRDGRYYQRRVDGLSLGAVYLATRGATFLLGVCEQLTCPSHDGRQPFRYAGSVGPLPRSRLRELRLDDNLAKLGNAVTSAFPMSGIFSLDFLLDAGTQIRPLEINPRITASVELIERSLGESLVARHAGACRERVDGESGEEAEAETGDFGRESLSLYPASFAVHGKLIVYADEPIECMPEHVTIELLRRRRAAELRGECSPIGDIPRAGTTIRRDDPIATVFASADDPDTVRRRLAAAEQELRDLLKS